MKISLCSKLNIQSKKHNFLLILDKTIFCQQQWGLHYSFPLSTVQWLILLIISRHEHIFNVEKDFSQKTTWFLLLRHSCLQRLTWSPEFSRTRGNNCSVSFSCIPASDFIIMGLTICFILNKNKNKRHIMKSKWITDWKDRLILHLKHKSKSNSGFIVCRKYTI